MGEQQPAQERPQVVERVARLLAAVSHRGLSGARLKELALDTGIARPTVHRLLGELLAVGYVQQRPDRRWTLGPALFSLGLTAPSPIRDLQSVRQLAQSLADHCGDVVYVALRRLDGVHYLLRVEGDYPIRTHLVAAGDTKPLTAGYAGLALLAAMGEEEQRVRIQRMALDAPPDWIDKNRWGVERAIREKLAEVAALGYCAGPNVVMPGVAGMAAPVPSRTQSPYLALSISAVEQRLSPERVQALAPRLLATARDMSAFID
ncbi:IclR family transcriptional regulator [Azohydromonas aeria]|uniref:IclR family transcriptional regulator n=1 Tax=Azohydromonas aeria TaxID=2590212 RepID=UPI0012FAC839|nr:IclR family transcriptional regulator [Azohydromonas aeria]